MIQIMASYQSPLKTCRPSVLPALSADLPNVNVIYPLFLKMCRFSLMLWKSSGGDSNLPWA